MDNSTDNVMANRLAQMETEIHKIYDLLEKIHQHLIEVDFKRYQ